MNLREITIGRAKDCDIYLDPRCKYASSHHATIYSDGNQLMYKDTSINGTLINNINVKHRAVPIRRGDTIMLASQYPLNWKQIDYFFPPTNPYKATEVPEGATIAGSQFDMIAQTDYSQELRKWSWGAFGIYSIWGFFNGCWWAFFIAFIPFAFPIANILFGIYGNRLAWNNKKWTSYKDFKDAQSKWAIAGIVIFCINIIFIIFLLPMYMSLIAHYL